MFNQLHPSPVPSQVLQAPGGATLGTRRGAALVADAAAATAQPGDPRGGGTRYFGWFFNGVYPIVTIGSIGKMCVFVVTEGFERLDIS